MKQNLPKVIRFGEIEHTPAGGGSSCKGNGSGVGPPEKQLAKPRTNDCNVDIRLSILDTVASLCICWREASTASSSSSKIESTSSGRIRCKIGFRAPLSAAFGISSLNLRCHSNVASIPTRLSARTRTKEYKIKRFTEMKKTRWNSRSRTQILTVILQNSIQAVQNIILKYSSYRNSDWGAWSCEGVLWVCKLLSRCQTQMISRRLAAGLDSVSLQARSHAQYFLWGTRGKIDKSLSRVVKQLISEEQRLKVKVYNTANLI
jgi:hypothetical protein